MNLLISFVKQTFTDVWRLLSFKGSVSVALGISFYRNALFIFISNLFLPIGGFIFWLIAARLYTDADVGLASAVISAASLLALLSLGGFGYAIIGFYPKYERNQSEFLNSCLTFTGLISIILSLAFISGLNIWMPALLTLRESFLISLAFIAFTLSLTANSILHSGFIGRRCAEFSLIQQLVFQIGRVVLPFFLLGLGFLGIFSAWGISIAASFITGLFILMHIQTGYFPFPYLRKEVIKELVRFAGANWFIDLLSASAMLLLPLMVIAFLGPESNAYFYIAASLIGVSMSAVEALSLSLFVEGSYRQEEIRLNIIRVAKVALLTITPSLLLLLLLGDKILLLFGVTYSQNATELLRILALVLPAGCITSIYFSAMRAQKKMKPLLILSSLRISAFLTLCYLLLPSQGLIGVGIASLAVNIALAVPSGWGLLRIIKR